MYQTDNIINKAKQLGINVGSSNSQADTLRTIASQVGLENFNSIEDIDKLEEILDNKLQEKENIEQTDNSNNSNSNYNNHNNFSGQGRFGEEEYNQAKDENGVYDKDYYKNRQEELDRKLADAEAEKSRNWKKIDSDGQEKKENLKNDKESSKKSEDEKISENNDKNNEENQGSNEDRLTRVKADGSDTKNKNVLDRAKDRVNVAKARQDAIQNKLASAKANAYKMTHPQEALKDVAKNKVKAVAKDTGKAASKTVAKGAQAVGKAIIRFIISNPYVLLIIGGILLLLIIILLIVAIFGGDSNMSGSGGVFGYCNANCDGMSISTTSFSRKEFIEKVQEYFEGNTNDYAKTFSDNAGLIYDIAINSNVNPELVIVRAIAEGFEPEKSCEGTYNNYWGITCYNEGGCAVCSTFDSFEDGIIRFVEIVSKYESVTDMMSHYAYIGSYWYNPGGDSIGGCYYYPYIKDYMSESRASEVEKICSGSACYAGGGAGCTATTDEDQEAYAMWQVAKNMSTIRYNVFGLTADECNTKCYTGDYSIDPNAELYAGLQLLHDTSFESVLADNGMTVESYNEYLYNAIEEAGIGTRKGVVAAATTLIGSLAEMGYKINYQWGGKYDATGINGSWGVSSYTDCNDYEARGYEKSECTTNYVWSGLDCSGFVNWALINGFQISYSESSSMGLYQFTTTNNGIALDPNKAVCEAGDVLVNAGHIALIIGIDDETKNYITAESRGSNIYTNSGGVYINYRSYSEAGYVCRSLEDFYN